jgi:hypothetical protein
VIRRRAGRGRGRGVAQLVADFGHQLPPLSPAPVRPEDADPFPFLAGRRGQRGQAAGWCPVPAPLAVYRMTSEEAGGCGR